VSRLPETGPSLMRWLRQQERNAQRQAASSSYNRSGTSVTAEGETTVTGALILKPGSITDVDMANPAVRQAVNLTTTAFAPTSTWGEVAGLDLTVPADCTRLLVTASAWVYAVNNTAAADDLHARVSLAAVDGQAFLTPLPVAGYNTISAGLATLAEFLTPGSTLRLLASAKTTTGTFTTDPANTATLVASLTWLR
jgi:hypothetical protein